MKDNIALRQPQRALRLQLISTDPLHLNHNLQKLTVIAVPVSLLTLPFWLRGYIGVVPGCCSQHVLDTCTSKAHASLLVSLAGSSQAK